MFEEKEDKKRKSVIVKEFEGIVCIERMVSNQISEEGTEIEVKK